jgi:hypothetical protein
VRTANNKSRRMRSCVINLCEFYRSYNYTKSLQVMLTFSIQTIEKQAFNQLHVPILFHDPPTSKVFSTVRFQQNEFKFAWQSDLIKPEINEVSPGIYSIGIDLNYVVVDFNSGKILCTVNLSSFFVVSLALTEFILIITQLEVIQLNKQGFAIQRTYALPDIFDRVAFNDGKVEIFSVDGSITLINQS